MDNNELKHWGVKGQKWGQRRYQNKDGTLTPAGRKRYNKEMEKLKAEEKILKNKARTQAKLGKLDSKRQELDDLRTQLGESKKEKRGLFGRKEKKAETVDTTESKNTKVKKKKLKDMTNDELRAAINRMDMEKRYEALTNNPDGVDKAKGWIKETFTNAASDLGKQTVKHFGAKFINKVFNEEVISVNNKKK